jgi:SAM-dependent methyltransferase
MLETSVSGMLNAAEAAGCPAAALPVLGNYLAGKVSAEIALMHLLMAAGSLAGLETCLERLAATGHDPLLRLARLAAGHRKGLAGATRLVEAGLTAAHGADLLAATREQYDRAAAMAPEAAVALYSLGDPAILDRATAELAVLLDAWGLLGPDRDALDIGCGIGRIERAVAPRLRHITGIDLSPAMIAEARRRGAGIANAEFAVTDGTGLSQFASASYDLILAIDSFPVIFAVARDLAEKHVRDAARLLRPGGALAIFNYSYRGDLAADRADLAALAGICRLQVECNGARELALWDGTSFLLTAPPRRG